MTICNKRIMDYYMDYLDMEVKDYTTEDIRTILSTKIYDKLSNDELGLLYRYIDGMTDEYRKIEQHILLNKGLIKEEDIHKLDRLEKENHYMHDWNYLCTGVTTLFEVYKYESEVNYPEDIFSEEVYNTFYYEYMEKQFQYLIDRLEYNEFHMKGVSDRFYNIMVNALTKVIYYLGEDGVNRIGERFIEQGKECVRVKYKRLSELKGYDLTDEGIVKNINEIENAIEERGYTAIAEIIDRKGWLGSRLM